MNARFFMILFGVVCRLLPHLPNFTPMNALALFGVFYMNKRDAVLTLFSTMLLSDLVLGFHSTMFFVYLSYGLVIFTAHNWLRRLTFFQAGFFSSLLFFVITNFGVWMMDGMYPLTLPGLGLCYLAGLPFFVNQLAGDLLYGTALYLGFKWWASKVRPLSS